VEPPAEYGADAVTHRTEVTYVAGLDLGQASDFTAIAVLERRLTESGGATELVETDHGYVTHHPPHRKDVRYAVRHLVRWPLGTPYTAVVKSVREIFAVEPLAGQTLAVDATGVGQPVVEMFRSAMIDAHLRPVVITAGNRATVDEAGCWHVPKKELVSVLQLLLQWRRISVAKSLPHAAVLVRELEAFRVKVTAAGNETFEAWRERDHDDLVLAVAMAAWIAEHGQREAWLA